MMKHKELKETPSQRTQIFIMKKLTLLLLAILPFIAMATNYTSTANGNWSSSSTWSPSGVPGSTDTVTIANMVTLDANESVYSITINSSKTLTVSGSNTLTVYRNFTNNGTFTYSTGTVTFAGSVNQIIGGSSTTTFYNLTTNPSASTDSVSLSKAIHINNNFTISEGVFACATFSITGNTTGTMSMASGTTLVLGLTSSSTLPGFPSTFTTAHISLDSASTVVYQANNTSTGQTVSGTPYYGNLLVTTSSAGTSGVSKSCIKGNLTIASGVTFKNNTINYDTIKGNLIINSGATYYAYAAAEYLQGNVTNNGTYHGVYTTVFDGSTNQILSGVNGPINTLFNGLSLTPKVSTDTTFIEANVKIGSTFDNSGTFFVPAAYNDSVIMENVNNLGTITAQNGVAYILSGQLKDNLYSFHKMTVGSACTQYASIAIASDFTILAGTYSDYSTAYTLNVGGNYISNGGAVSATVIMNGSHNQTISGTSSDMGSIQINQSSSTDTVTLGSSINVWNVTITQGNLNGGSSNYNLTFLHEWTNNANFIPGNGTVTFGVPNGFMNLGGTSVTTFNNLTINSSSSYALVLSNNVIIKGNLLLTTGALEASSSNYSVTLGGNFTNNAAANAFQPSSGLVKLNGSGNQTIGGTYTTTFYNLTQKQAASTDTLFLGDSITVNHNLADSSGVFDCQANKIKGNTSGTFTMASGTNMLLGAASSSTNVAFPTLFTTAHTTLNSGSTISYLANTAQTISTTPTYGNLVLGSGSSTTRKTPASSPLAVAGNLCVNANTTLVENTGTLNLTGNLTNADTVLFTTGAMNIGGTFTNNGYYAYGTGTATFNGSANAQVTGSNAPTFYNLTLNKSTVADTLFLLHPITVNNTLTITQGLLDCKGNQLTNSANPVVTLSPTAATICSGSSTSLTASGYSSYTWCPSTGLSATTGSSVTASPSASTTYTVFAIQTSKYHCALTAGSVGGVMVNTTPTVTISPSTSAICVGNSASLTASGASTYSWSPSTGLNTTTGTTVSANPTSSITYTVTGTGSNGCTSVQTVVVTVNPLPTLTVTPSSASICLNTSTILTVGGANTYIWSPSSGLTTTTGSSIFARPLSTVTYTVVGTDNNGCTNTNTQTISVSNCYGSTCAKPMPLMVGQNLIDSLPALSSKWISIGAENKALTFTIVNDSSSIGYVDTLALYDSCGGTKLMQVTVDSIAHDSITITDTNLIPGRTYFLLVTTNNGDPRFHEKVNPNPGATGDFIEIYYYPTYYQGTWEFSDVVIRDGYDPNYSSDPDYSKIMDNSGTVSVCQGMDVSFPCQAHGASQTLYLVIWDATLNAYVYTPTTDDYVFNTPGSYIAEYNYDQYGQGTTWMQVVVNVYPTPNPDFTITPAIPCPGVPVTISESNNFLTSLNGTNFVNNYDVLSIGWTDQEGYNDPYANPNSPYSLGFGNATWNTPSSSLGSQLTLIESYGGSTYQFRPPNHGGPYVTGCAANKTYPVTENSGYIVITGPDFACSNSLTYCANVTGGSGSYSTGTWTISGGSLTPATTTGCLSSVTATFTDPTIGGTVTYTTNDLGLGCEYTTTYIVGGCCSSSSTVVAFNDQSVSALHPSFTSAYPTYASFSTTTQTVTLVDFDGVSSSEPSININGTLTVDGNLEIDCSDILMGAHAQIVVTGGHSLTLNGCHIHACDNMWDSIIVGNGCTLTINGSLIEDGINAVVIPDGGGTYNISGAIFNNDYIGLVVRGVGTFSGTISGSTFSSYQSTSSFSSCYSFSLDNTTPTTLLPPYSSVRGSIGMKISLANITVGSASGDGNIFENLDCGIYSRASNSTIINNTFTNIGGVSSGPNAQQTGISAIGDQTGIYTVTIGGTATGDANTFINCQIGIFADDTVNAVITNNSFDGGTSTSIYNTSGIVPQVSGILIGDNFLTKFPISGNTINNYEVGIFSLNNLNSSLYVSANNINGGTIWAGSPSYGIILNEFTPSANTFLGIGVGQSGVGPSTYNTISNVDIGVVCTNTQGVTAVQGNSITTDGLGEGDDAGIFLNNSFGTKITGNTISQSQSPSSLIGNGIFVANGNSGNIVNCNTIDGFNNALLFTGPQTPGTRLDQNNLSNYNNGLYLASSGTIGPQGTIDYTTDNEWAIFSGSSANATFVDATSNPTGNPTTFDVFCPTLSVSNTYPTNNAVGGSATPISFTPLNVGDCYDCQDMFICGNNNHRPTHHGTLPDTAAIRLSVSTALRVIRDSANFTLMSHSSHWHEKYALYRYLTSIDSSLVDSDATIKKYRDSLALDNMGKLEKINLLLADTNGVSPSDISIATALNSSLINPDTIESTSQTVNTILISMKSARRNRPDSMQLITLRTIAPLCPLQYGNSVYIARSLLFADKVKYSNSCEFSSQRHERDRKVNSIDNTQVFAKIYPDPANSILNIETEIPQGQTYKMCLYSFIGQQVKCNDLKSSFTTINIEELTPGLYYCRIVDNAGRLISTQKITIIH